MDNASDTLSNSPLPLPTGQSQTGHLEVKRQELPVPQPASFRWDLLILTLLLSGILGIVIGGLLPYSWTSLIHWTPFLLASLVIGWTLGFSWAICARVFEIGHRWTFRVGFLVIVFIGVISPHRIAFDQSYEATLRQIEQQMRNISPKDSNLDSGQIVSEITREMLPKSSWDFLNRSAAYGRKIGPWKIYDQWVWLSWVADTLVLIAGAVYGAKLAARRFVCCGACGRFYRQLSSGETTTARLRQLTIKYQLPCVLPKSFEDETLLQWFVLACPGACGHGLLLLELPSSTLLMPPKRAWKVWFDSETVSAVLRELRKTAI
ncbi:MAG: hypothetical protein PHE53_06465 [Thermoguttaceae bacterium]|nr:hypothetical protein [Thermoguttaceae bacterium]